MASTLSAVARRSRPSSPEMALPPVFVVEGDDAVRASLLWLLESLGVRARAFASPEEFLDSFEGVPGCVMLDVGLRGPARVLDFSAELRARRLELPLVAMSADPFLTADDVRRAGAVAFLAKPFHCEKLIDCLRDVCEGN